MADEEILGRNIVEIATYTAKHPELTTAHHFLYDLKSPSDGTPRFVVMGINPGESPKDWRIAPTPTEETSRFDFHHVEEKRGSAKRWHNLANYFLDGADYVLAEIFFWSSRSLVQFHERFGPLAKSDHLKFCRDKNRDLIMAYEPEAIILPGLTISRLCQKLYNLEHMETTYSEGVKVAEKYSDGSRPWLFTKHWTGARGFSRDQRVKVLETIRQLGQTRP